VLPDHLLIELSRRQPRTERDLGAIRGLSSRVARQVRSQIPALIAQALELPDEQLPPPTDRGGRDADCRAAVDLAAAVVSHLARRQQVAPDLLATRRELERYFLWRLGASEKPPETCTVGWRAALLSDPLEALFAGRTQLSLQRAGKNLRLRVQPDDVAKADSPQ
jgi:ribonuclease D